MRVRLIENFKRRKKGFFFSSLSMSLKDTKVFCVCWILAAVDWISKKVHTRDKGVFLSFFLLFSSLNPFYHHSNSKFEKKVIMQNDRQVAFDPFAPCALYVKSELASFRFLPPQFGAKSVLGRAPGDKWIECVQRSNSKIQFSILNNFDHNRNLFSSQGPWPLYQFESSFLIKMPEKWTISLVSNKGPVAWWKKKAGGSLGNLLQLDN